MEASGQLDALSSLVLRNELPLQIECGPEWAPEASGQRHFFLSLLGIEHQFSDCVAHSLSMYQLGYPGRNNCNNNVAELGPSL
jgi:hypothetical protein